MGLDWTPGIVVEISNDAEMLGDKLEIDSSTDTLDFIETLDTSVAVPMISDDEARSTVLDGI